MQQELHHLVDLVARRPNGVRALSILIDQATVLSETLLAREGGFDCVVQQILALVDNHFMTGALIPVDGGRRLA